eukprot:m.10145 g.10145  ORF g.10145 m.10145 type:complete len:283 (+) comp4207_c0_seq1:244-1092(+)
MAPTERQNLSLLYRIPMIQAASLVAESCTFPVDAVKTRMQVKTKSHAFFPLLRSTVQVEGVSGLYKGLQPAVIRHWVYSAARISLYEDFRNKMAPDGNGKNAPLYVKAVSGLMAGGIGQLLASPADLVKVRLQTGKGMGSFSATLRGIWKTEGLRGFYRGWQPNVVRASIVNIGELATYDEAKRMVMRISGLPDGLLSHTLSALCSGLVASFLSTPADVCKSRVMAGMYPSMLSCLIHTAKTEGVTALWKGFGPTWLRLGPWQFCFWITYENIRIRTTGAGF